MNRLLLPVVFLALAACTPTPKIPSKVAVADILCRPTLNGRDVTGCYLTLTAERDDRLVSVSSPAAGTAQIHEMKVEDGMMKMTELKDGLPLPAGQPVSLAPGGNHIMLMALTQPLSVGDQVSLTLSFEHAQQIGVRAIVSQPAVAAKSPDTAG
ncbi:hypothetical protein KOAAANKH_01951 [Brevundimonas sp. NIBR10]|uniref:copper chaperone PCu(A)C n=1 Tax=Brevundimonas sp. NIBR10 TaxID=3015997 RepID=UPI0022F157C6|nr:copper chaperone PCu(A)C [Brevundimonas sp. NIBR10]WGM47077.1 hypothetical protein KOAAANKH_01951 [Brevundimonas sp. NIBR10]